MSKALSSSNSISSVESSPLKLVKTEVVTGANKLPKRLYLLVDAQGNEIIDEPVSRSELIDVILESEIIEDINRMVFDICGCACEHCFEEEARELAEELAIDAGYRIIEVLK